MGIEKAPGEYITEMTEPTGWPDIDEDLRHTLAIAVAEAR